MFPPCLLPRLGLSRLTGATKCIANSTFTSPIFTSTSSFSTTAIPKIQLSNFGQQGISKSILSRNTRGAFIGASSSNSSGGGVFGNASIGGVGGLGRLVAGPVIFVRGMAKKKGGRVKDKRVRMIRYSLNHPLMPRPLRFGTMRMLRHWTIHRAWLLYQRKLRTARELELEQQWNEMRQACEELAKVDPRLYRIAIAKREIGYFPRELRIPTDTPPREGWNHGWVRPTGRG